MPPMARESQGKIQEPVKVRVLPDFGIWNAQTDYSGKVIHFVLESRGK